VEQILGEESARWVESAVSSLNKPTEAGSWIAFLVSACAILWAATGLFVHLQNAWTRSGAFPAHESTSVAVVRQRLLAS